MQFLYIYTLNSTYTNPRFLFISFSDYYWSNPGNKHFYCLFFSFFLLLKEAVFDVSQILRKILINYYLILLSNKMISYKLSFLAKKKKLRILVPK